MKRLALTSNSLLNQSAHKPFSQNQCCPSNGGMENIRTSCLESHTLRCVQAAEEMHLSHPLSGPRRQHTLFYHQDAVCIQTTLTAKLQVIKWKTVASSHCYKWQRENVTSECTFSSRHTRWCCFRFQSMHVHFWKTQAVPFRSLSFTFNIDLSVNLRIFSDKHKKCFRCWVIKTLL